MRVAVKETITNVKKVDLRKYLSDLELLYKKWHRHHKKFCFLKKTKSLIGSRFLFEEEIDGTLVSMKGNIESCSSTFISWKSTSKIIIAGGSISRSGNKIIQEVYFEIPLFFYILGKILRKSITQQQLSEHVKEELQGMRKVIKGWPSN